ncbi:MAG: hypothetical protein RLZZ367_1020, partial [Bacteroidota bacterium]
MKQINRLEFLGAVYGKSLDGETPVKKQLPENEFANKVLPQFDSRATTGLNEYTGTFGDAQLAHLLRRTLFGVTKADMTAFSGMSLAQ